MKSQAKRIIIISIIIGSIILLPLILLTSFFIDEAHDKKIESYLSDYEKNEQVIMAREEMIFFSNRIVNLKELYPESTLCRTIYADSDSVFYSIYTSGKEGYTASVYKADLNLTNKELVVNSFFAWESSGHSIEIAVYMPNKEKIFFLNRKDNRFYYDIGTKETIYLSKEYEDYKYYDYDSFPWGDFIDSEEAFSSYEKGNTVTITNEETRETKTIKKDDLLVKDSEIKKHNNVRFEKVICDKNDIYLIYSSSTTRYIIIYKYDYYNETVILYAWNNVDYDAYKAKIFFLS